MPCLATWAICAEYGSVQSEEEGGGHEHPETIPWFFSSSVMVYFTCRHGHETNGFTPPPKDSWWFIGAQSGAGLSDSQDLQNGTMAKDVGL